ncbi:MAG: hypothetical protein RR424_06630 [Oscillospiraceae bacterium]
MSNLLILGAGGYGHVIKECAQAMNIYEKIDYLDDMSIDAIGKCDEYLQYIDEYKSAYPAFGNNMLRMQWIMRLEAAHYVLPTFIHPTAYVSPSAKLACGVAILAHATVGARAVIDKGVIINAAAVADHNCIIREGVHVAPAAVVKASAVVEKLAKIESGEVLFAGR